MGFAGTAVELIVRTWSAFLFAVGRLINAIVALDAALLARMISQLIGVYCWLARDWNAGALLAGALLAMSIVACAELALRLSC